MNKTIYKLLYLGCFLLVFISMSCHKQLKPASVILIDPVRHYYPIIQGDRLVASFEIENTSENPLFIQEVQTTCGCVAPHDELPIIILPHKSGFVKVEFNTIKNTGYVQHYVYCYGNFKDSAFVEMQFDTNVVPRADYIRDYEQLWQESESSPLSIRTFVDGSPTQKGYYVDDFVNPREEEKEELQEEADKLAF